MSSSQPPPIKEPMFLSSGQMSPVWVKFFELISPIGDAGGSGVTSVTGTSPVVSSGGNTPAISMPAATASTPGYATAEQITQLEDAILNSDESTEDMQFVIDEDDMASDSPIKVPTQQSTKAYIDSNSPIGYREGLSVTIKDNDELYISGGAIDIGGIIYGSVIQITFPLGSIIADTLLYVYVNKPASGNVLTASEFTISSTAPIFDHIYGAYYKAGDSTKRLLAKYYLVGVAIGPFTPGVEADDGWWKTGGIFYNSGVYHVYIGATDNTLTCTGFIRFPNIPILNGEVIASAALTMTAKVVVNPPMSADIYANDIDNAVAPTSEPQASALVKTTAFVPWTINGVNGESYTSPDIGAVIQEVVDRPGFALNNAIMLLITAPGANPQHYIAMSGYLDGVKMASLAIIVSTGGTPSVIDDHNIPIRMDSDNVLNDEEILVYDTLVDGFKGVEKSTDGTMVGNSDEAIPTEKAVKTYADTKVPLSLFDANSILMAVTDDTPAAMSVAASTIVGRKATGNIDDLSPTEARVVLGLAVGDSPVFVTAKLSGLTDDYIPYHVDDATGLANGPTKTNVDSAVSLKHTQGSDTALGALGTKNPPIDADKLIYRDSESTDGLVTSTFTQIKAFLKTYFDGIYATVASLLGYATKTTAALNITIGAGGDYATFAEAIAAVPDLLAHTVTLTVKKGTTLTEQCTIQNKHAMVSGAVLNVLSERYYPATNIVLPTADGAGATYLEDTSVFTVDDYYNDCWVYIVHGTGTDNGFVKITDTDAATGRISVASWPGTQPDATSRYEIVGALVDGESTRYYGAFIAYNTTPCYLKGIGIKNVLYHGVSALFGFFVDVRFCGCYNIGFSGVAFTSMLRADCWYSGLVKCNTSNIYIYGGVSIQSSNDSIISRCGISDNLSQGIYVNQGAVVRSTNNFGDNNGTWGAYAAASGQIACTGTECSGSSGNHSNAAGDGSLAY